MFKDTIRSLFGEEGVTYVARKHRGGQSGKKGTRYEDFFILYLIAFNSRNVLERRSDVRIHSQLETYLDDVVLVENQTRWEFYQLKDQQKLTWATGNLTSDFLNQKDVNIKRGIGDARLRLVVSRKDLADKLQIEVPNSIAGETDVQFFGAGSTLREVIDANPELKECLTYLCATPDWDPVGLDKLQAVGSTLLGAWGSLGSDELTLCDFLEKARNLPKASFIRPKEEIEQLDKRFEEILEGIGDFHFVLAKGYFHWSYLEGLEKGSFPFDCNSEEFQRFVARVIEREPKSFEKLEELFWWALEYSAKQRWPTKRSNYFSTNW